LWAAAAIAVFYLLDYFLAIVILAADLVRIVRPPACLGDTYIKRYM